jgi:hypothetical protein
MEEREWRRNTMRIMKYLNFEIKNGQMKNSKQAKGKEVVNFNISIKQSKYRIQYCFIQSIMNQ